jgi:hypothetical protein
VPHFQLLARAINVAEIVEQLEAHPELWNQFGLRKAGEASPHKAAPDIWVRYNDIRPYQERGSFEGFNDPHIPIWYPAWHALPALRPTVMSMAAHFQAEMIGGVLITKVPPGGRIAPHTDKGWHVDYFDKFYLSLKAPEDCVFATAHQAITPKVGDLWLFDNRVEHWVINDSETEERITLIVCLRTAMFGRHP